MLTLMLVVQFTMMFGAIKAKGYVDMVEDNVSELIEGVNGVVTADESKEIIDELASENSLVGLFIDKVNVEGKRWQSCRTWWRMHIVTVSTHGYGTASGGYLARLWWQSR